jgi:hypothetical protein
MRAGWTAPDNTENRHSHFYSTTTLGTVIPAQAGIHADHEPSMRQNQKNGMRRMGPRLRGKSILQWQERRFWCQHEKRALRRA